MFGGQDNNGQMQDNTAAAPNDGLVSSSMAMPEPGGVSAPGAPMPGQGFDSGYPATDGVAGGPSTPAPGGNAVTVPQQPGDIPGASVGAPVGDSDDLLQIKQQALQQLSPLVGHLDQSPEDKFRTTMMMIQASDNQALIKEAYEAANAIQDEKARAQALLDIVNEINYFTQSKQPEAGVAPQQ